MVDVFAWLTNPLGYAFMVRGLIAAIEITADKIRMRTP